MIHAVSYSLPFIADTIGFITVYSKTSNNGPSEKRTTSLQRTAHLRLVQYWLNLPLKINLTLRMSNCIVSVIQLYMFYSCLICIIMYNEDFASLFCKVSQCTYNHNLTIYQCYNLVCQIYYILSSLVLFVIDVKSNLYILYILYN